MPGFGPRSRKKLYAYRGVYRPSLKDERPKEDERPKGPKGSDRCGVTTGS